MLLVAVAGILVTAARAEREQREFRMAEQQEQGNQAEQVGRTVGMALARIYEGLRTMSRLPGVQRACISGIALDDNARLTVQELYNALASAVALSEVYVVPRNMDPDAQPDAGVPVAPLVTFDELILDRGRAEGGATGAASATGPAVEEVEIFEYRLMRSQLMAMAATVPTRDRVHGLAVPIFAGAPVVTCDNSRFDVRKPEDEDRRGLVLSVPIFAEDGRLAGCMSGVILDHALRDLLPDGRFAIANPGHAVLLGKDLAAAEWKRCLADATAGRPAKDLLQSQVIPLGLPDPQGEWMVWFGVDERPFLQRADVIELRRFSAFLFAAISLGAFAGAGTLLWLGWRRRQEALRVAAVLALVDRVCAGDLAPAPADAREDAIGCLASGVARLITAQREQVQAMAGMAARLNANAMALATAQQALVAAAQSSSVAAVEVAGAGEQVSGSVGSLAGVGARLEGSSGRVVQAVSAAVAQAKSAVERSERTVEAVRSLSQAIADIGAVLDLINGIATRTDLLALNAAIEAASAGAAGRGFTVVAGEVKALSHRVGEATADIARRIASIHSSSDVVAAEIAAIEAAIQAIHRDQDTIAAAAGDQTATAHDLSDHAAQAAVAVADIGRSLHALRDDTRVTAQAAAGVASAIDDITRAAAELDAQVARYRTIG